MENSSTPTVYCKDCTYSTKSFFHTITFQKYYECLHDSSYEQPKVSPVTGPVNKGWYNDCAHMRSNPVKCGREGRFWTPRNSKKFLFTILKQEN